MLQIPAFLCRQTDLLLAAAATGKVVNVKKGQFLAPWDMANVVDKSPAPAIPTCWSPSAAPRSATTPWCRTCGRCRSLRAHRRARDLRRHPFGAAARREGHLSGGQREFVPVLARAAVAVGVAGVFIETHPDPDHAPSDGPNMVPLRDFEALVRNLMAFDALAEKIEKRQPDDVAELRTEIVSDRNASIDRCPVRCRASCHVECAGEERTGQADQHDSGRARSRAVCHAGVPVCAASRGRFDPLHRCRRDASRGLSVVSSWAYRHGDLTRVIRSRAAVPR